MKVAIAFILLVAAVCAHDLDNRARESFVNNVNAARQQRVNRVAEAIGASSGTYRKDGVPGVHPYGAAYPYGAGYGYGAAFPYGAGYGGYGYGAFPYGGGAYPYGYYY